jgi:hypothetical protein
MKNYDYANGNLFFIEIESAYNDLPELAKLLI